MTSIQVLRSKEKKEEEEDWEWGIRIAIENDWVNAGLMRGTMGTQGESWEPWARPVEYQSCEGREPGQTLETNDTRVAHGFTEDTWASCPLSLKLTLPYRHPRYVRKLVPSQHSQQSRSICFYASFLRLWSTDLCLPCHSIALGRSHVCSAVIREVGDTAWETPSWSGIAELQQKETPSQTSFIGRVCLIEGLWDPQGRAEEGGNITTGARKTVQVLPPSLPLSHLWVVPLSRGLSVNDFI